MNTIQYSPQSGSLYATSVSLGPPEFSTHTASRSLQLFLLGLFGDRPTERPTEHATRSVTIGRIYVRNSAMWSNDMYDTWAVKKVKIVLSKNL